MRFVGVFRDNSQLHLFSSAKHGQFRSRSHANLGQQAMQIIDARYRLPFERNNHVALAQSGPERRTAGLSGDHDHARFLGQIVVANQAAVDGNSLRGHSDIAAPDSSVAKQAAVLAYIDGFLAAAVGALICLFCVMLLPATRFANQATNDRNRG